MSTEAFFIAETRPLRPLAFFPALWQAVFELRHTIMHYAGFLGPTNDLNPPKIFFIGYTIIISILTMIGLVKVWQKQKIIVEYFFSLMVFLFVLSFYFKRSGLSWDIQGRYFLAGFFPLAIFVFFGLLTIFKKNKLARWIAIIFSILHYYFVLFFVLLPGYYRFNLIGYQLEAIHYGFSYFFYFFLIGHLGLVLSIGNFLKNHY
jgi:hypothetical protein